jgi:hypothetical protein
MIQDLNGFSKYVKITGRSWDKLIIELVNQVQVPATIVQWGESSTGASWAIVRLTAKEPGKAPKITEPVIPTGIKSEPIES